MSPDNVTKVELTKYSSGIQYSNDYLHLDDENSFSVLPNFKASLNGREFKHIYITGTKKYFYPVFKKALELLDKQPIPTILDQEDLIKSECKQSFPRKTLDLDIFYGGESEQALIQSEITIKMAMQEWEGKKLTVNFIAPDLYNGSDTKKTIRSFTV